MVAVDSGQPLRIGHRPRIGEYGTSGGRGAQTRVRSRCRVPRPTTAGRLVPAGWLSDSGSVPGSRQTRSERQTRRCNACGSRRRLRRGRAFPERVGRAPAERQEVQTNGPDLLLTLDLGRLQLSGVAFWTNSLVKVLLMSIDLPCTFGLKADRTARQVAGPSAGISPVGL